MKCRTILTRYFLRHVLALAASSLVVQQISSYDAKAADYGVLPVRGTNTIMFVIDGQIESEEEAELIKRYINTSSNSAFDREVYLAGPGGSLHAAMVLGRFFRKNKIRSLTVPLEACESACGMAFLGGTKSESNTPSGFPRVGTIDRTRTYGSVLSFHFFSHKVEANANNSDSSVRQIEDSCRSTFHDIMVYFEEMGVRWSLLKKMTATSQSSVYTLDGTDFVEYNIKDDGMSSERTSVVREAYIKWKSRHDSK